MKPLALALKTATKKLLTDGDFRNWGEIDGWAKSIAASLVSAGVS